MNAKDYATREDLEVAVRKLTSTVDVTITGTKEELKRLFLSNTTTVFGVPCVQVDEQGKPVALEVAEIKEKPPRGEVHDFGLDGNLKKPI